MKFILFKHIDDVLIDKTNVCIAFRSKPETVDASCCITSPLISGDLSAGFVSRFCSGQVGYWWIVARLHYCLRFKVLTYSHWHVRFYINSTSVRPCRFPPRHILIIGRYLWQVETSSSPPRGEVTDGLRAVHSDSWPFDWISRCSFRENADIPATIGINVGI